ncbi:MAG: dihydroneopterin aldolase [Saprospiraceae bacterium]
MGQNKLGKLVLNELEFFAFHGYYEVEKKIKQKFIVDVEISIELSDKDKYNIKDLANYEDVVSCIRAQIQISEELIENLAIRMSESVFSLSNHIVNCKLRITKYPQVGQKMTGVSFEIEQGRVE